MSAKTWSLRQATWVKGGPKHLHQQPECSAETRDEDCEFSRRCELAFTSTRNDCSWIFFCENSDAFGEGGYPGVGRQDVRLQDGCLEVNISIVHTYAYVESANDRQIKYCTVHTGILRSHTELKCIFLVVGQVYLLHFTQQITKFTL